MIGQVRVKDYFDKVLQNEALSHAYLFKGSRGVGKYSFALNLAKVLLGNNDKVALQIEAGSHPDLFVLSSDTLLGVKEIAPLYDFFSNRALMANIKICIIDNAQLLSPEAQNKLLKVTEEANNMLMIFVSSSNFALLPALNSRLICIAFADLNEVEMKTIIENKGWIMDEELLDLASGSIGEYKKLLEEDYQNQVKRLNKSLKELFSNNNFGDLSVLNGFKEDTSRLFFDLRRNLLQGIKLGKLGIDKIDTISSAIDEAESALLRGQNYNLISEGLIFKIEEAQCS